MSPAHSSGSVEVVGQELRVEVDHRQREQRPQEHAGGDALRRRAEAPDRVRGEQAAEDLDDRVARRNRRLARRALAARARATRRPGCSASAVIRCPQAGHAGARDDEVVARASRRAVSPRSSAHCALPAALQHLRQPMDHDVQEAADAKPDEQRDSVAMTDRHASRECQSAERVRGATNAARGVAISRGSGRDACGPDVRSDDGAELEDRQVHRDDEAADDDTRGTR